MKKTLLNFTRTMLTVAAFGLLASSALAWTPPTGGFPQGNVPAPVNTGTVTQTKNGTLRLTGNLNAAIAVVAGVVSKGTRGMFGCDPAIGGCAGIVPSSALEAGKYNANNSSAALSGGVSVSATGVTGIGAFPNGSLSQGISTNYDGNVSIGKIVAGAVLPTQGLFIGNALNQAMSVFFGKLSISLSGTGSTGRNALDIQVSPDNETNGDGAVLQTNADRFSFYNAGTLAAISAKKIRLTEGAAQGKVLTSDANGNASWGDGGNAITTDGLIRYVRNKSTDDAFAYCGSDAADDSNWIAIGGGGDCYYGVRISQPILSRGNDAHGDNAGTSTPAIGWRVSCLKNGTLLVADRVGRSGQSGDARAEAICMKRTGILSSSAATIGGGGGGGGGGATAWHTLASAPNGPATAATNGTSCAAWLAGGSYANSPKRGKGVVNVGVPITLGTDPDANGGSQSCIYQFASQMYQAGSGSGGAQATATPGLNSFKSSCIYASPTATFANAKPVKTCTDSAAVLDFSATGGQVVSGTYIANTEVKY